MHILHQVAPGLADELKAIPIQERRRIVGKACTFVGEGLQDLGPEIQDLLTTIAAENSLSDTQVEMARTLAEAADERYFALQEQGAAEAVWTEWFYKARLLTALWNGFNGTSWSDSADAIYELSATRHAPSDLIALVRREINSGQGQGNGDAAL